MDEQLYKYLNDILWWCPFKKLRYLIREYLKKIENIEKENKKIMNHLNFITNKMFPENKNIVVVNIGGGFADQMRAYLAAKSLEKFYNKKILFDISWYETNGMDNDKKYKRHFEFKNIFKDVEFNLANKDQIFLAKQSKYIDFWIDFINGRALESLKYLKQEKILYLSGIIAFTQFRIEEPNIFKLLKYTDVLRLDKYFIPLLDEKNKEVYNDIINTKNTVACHIRRTDYVKFCYYIDLNSDYYKKAFEIIKNKVNDKIKIFFFSDDLDWVKENIVPFIENIYDYRIVDINTNEKGYFDFYLISKCNYQIASSGNFCKVAYEFNEFENKILITSENINADQTRPDQTRPDQTRPDQTR